MEEEEKEKERMGNKKALYCMAPPHRILVPLLPSPPTDNIIAVVIDWKETSHSTYEQFL